MESDARFYRRRANEELAAAGRAVTQAARERRMILAGIFLDRLKTLETCGSSEIDFATAAGTPAFDWRNGSRRSF
ncbi:hypothetical protein [Sphingomonas hankyongi]|uniref:Uncharacterized protein n=1 Tax=Sphingomonas hankyongi TaxID=2908209 RepID=A0ABT0S254_9SPHN|nr:hypothetical protein [Sphingomonas hankyongi]MCL6729932.1 hypothetical protein [Sphingomonas hankyongi]